MTLDDYLSLFPGSTREKPRLMAVASAILRQVMDLQAVIPEMEAAFTPDSASGAQLDMLGGSLGLSRLETSAGVTVTDEEYRDYIRKKLMDPRISPGLFWDVCECPLCLFRMRPK